MQKDRAQVVISGMVQGVCFRYETCARARSLGLSGWVKNRVDGKVEAVFEGPADAVASMVSWSHHGPSGASVEHVEVKKEAYAGNFDGFDVRF